eukprot:6195521-Pleurochrysis_carterae.AAC.3
MPADNTAYGPAQAHRAPRRCGAPPQPARPRPLRPGTIASDLRRARTGGVARASVAVRPLNYPRVGLGMIWITGNSD